MLLSKIAIFATCKPVKGNRYIKTDILKKRFRIILSAETSTTSTRKYGMVVKVRSLWLVLSYPYDIRSKWSCYHLFSISRESKPAVDEGVIIGSTFLYA